MERPRAAERDERQAARVAPPLDGDDAQRAQHLRVHDLHDVGGVEPVERPLGCGAIELEAVGEPPGDPAEEEVRVGDGRPEPA